MDEFASDWFNHLFAGVLPYDAVLRVFDAYLSEGITTIWRMAVQPNAYRAHCFISSWIGHLRRF